MIFKVQKPLNDNEGNYLIYNKDRTIVNTFLKVGDNKEFDKLFSDLDYVIFVKGYINKKGKMILNRKVKKQNW